MESNFNKVPVNIPEKVYRTEIDGLKGFAILMVIIYHLNPNILPGGFLGVDIFFVISGYLITSSINYKIKENNKKFIYFIKSFYKKRFLRIFPSLIVYFLIFYLITIFLDPFPGITLSTGLNSIGGISNLYLQYKNYDYFSHHLNSNPFLVTWSLSLEIQFYLIYPIFIFLSNKFLKPNYQNLFIIFAAFLSGLYFLMNESLYFSPFSRIWEILFGCIVFNIYKKKNFKSFNLSNFYLTLILIGLTFPMIYIFKFKFLNHFIVVLCTSIIICSRVNQSSIIIKIFKSKFLTKLGKRSYSLFLWHWGILTLIYWTALTFNLKLFLLYLISLLILTELNHRYIEKNFIGLKINFHINKYLKYISTIFIIFFFIFSSKNRFNLLSITNYFLPENTRNIYYVNSSFDNQEKYFSLMPKLYKKNYSSDGKFLKNTKTVFLIGDSHVNNHIPSIVKAIQELEKQVNVVRLIGSFFYKDSNKFFTNYEQKNNFILSSLRSAINKGDILIFATDINDLKNKNKDKWSTKNILTLEKNINKIVEIAKKYDATLLLIDFLPKPCLGKELNSKNMNYTFLNQKNSITLKKADEIKSICDYPFELLKQYRIEMTKIYKSFSNSNSNVKLIDFSNDLCKEEICSPIDEKNKLIFRDQSPHLRSDNAFIFKEKWISLLKKIMN